MTTYLGINEEQIHESRDFCEIWIAERDEGMLSARRQHQGWRWINEHTFRKKEQIMLKASGITDPISNPESPLSS
jgi:hypothetical protein